MTNSLVSCFFDSRCSCYNYQHVYFTAYAGTSVYLLDNSQFSCVKQILKTCISTLTHTTMTLMLMIKLTCNCLNNTGR